jgi:lipid-binding SYLF domain-containing protein
VAKSIRILVTALAIAAAAVPAAGPRPARAATAAEIDRGVDATLRALYEKIPSARTLGEKAQGVLVFPNIVKAGFIVGGQYGEGALRRDGRTAGYYNTLAASYGLQAGAQSFGYALFLMTDQAMAHLERSNGWEVGVGPSIVVLDAGAARSLTTTTAQSDVYAFTFGQRGLMAGMGLQGSKISQG